MKNWTTKNEYKIYQVLSGRSNAYLILKDNQVILVDTGKSKSFETLVKNIDILNVNLDSISFLILTHTHFDHCQSTKKIKEKSDCQIIVSCMAADSISILVDNEIAIVGDTMFGVFKNSVIPPYSDDILDTIVSWGRLLTTDSKTFLPGHGKEIMRNLLETEYERHSRKHNTISKLK